MIPTTAAIRSQKKKTTEDCSVIGKLQPKAQAAQSFQASTFFGGNQINASTSVGQTPILTLVVVFQLEQKIKRFRFQMLALTRGLLKLDFFQTCLKLSFW